MLASKEAGKDVKAPNALFLSLSCNLLINLASTGKGACSSDPHYYRVRPIKVHTFPVLSDYLLQTHNYTTRRYTRWILNYRKHGFRTVPLLNTHMCVYADRPRWCGKQKRYYSKVAVIINKNSLTKKKGSKENAKCTKNWQLRLKSSKKTQCFSFDLFLG